MTRRWLAAILVASFALRVWLAAKGGQHFWWDESRFNSSESAAVYICHGQFVLALRDLFGHADHVFFRTAALPVALVEFLLGGDRQVLVSCYFALFSTGSIYLLWLICRRAGGSETEALWAAFLGATANSLFFYSRFFLPYDISLFLLLWALCLGVGRYSPLGSFFTGCVAGLGFLTYNGYWLLAAAVLLLHVVFGDGGGRRALLRGIVSACGLAIVTIAVFGIGEIVSGDLLRSYVTFAATVRQGDFHEAHRVIPEYLWYSERAVALVWLAALGYGAAAGFPRNLAGRMGWWLFGIAFLAGGLIVFSDLVPKFVVYGRLTRSLVPFACLGAARGIANFLEGGDGVRRRLTWALGGVTLGFAAFNFATPLRLVFPLDFTAKAAERIARENSEGYGLYRVLFAQTLAGRPVKDETDPHDELLRTENPMQFRPFQYEGYGRAERQKLNEVDIAMRLVRLKLPIVRPEGRWEGYPGPVRLTVTFRPEEIPSIEPIAVSGRPGRGDLLAIKYLDSDHIVFGLEHWGSFFAESEPVGVDLARPHDLVISAGFLFPPTDAKVFKDSPEMLSLRDHVAVIMDGHEVFARKEEFFDSSPRYIVFGTNTIGGSVVGHNLTAAVSDFRPADLAQIARAVPAIAMLEIVGRRSAEWSGAAGPLRLRFRMPQSAGGEPVGQPLISLQGPGTSDVLFVARAGARSLRIGLDRLGKGAWTTGPLQESDSGTDTVDVCIGSMLPPSGAAIYGRAPGLLGMREGAYVRFNGELVLSENAKFAPVAGSDTTVGANTVHSSACSDSFGGEIADTLALEPDSLLPIGTRLSRLLTEPAAIEGGFAGPVRMRVEFPPGRAGVTEPLIVSGASGAADALIVRYEGDGHIRLGYEHSRSEPVLSEPILVRSGESYDLLLSTGALMPPTGSRLYLAAPDLQCLHSLVGVGLNGIPVLSTWNEPYPASQDEVEVAANALGRIDCETRFSGRLVGLAGARPSEVIDERSAAGRLARTGWNGYPGPLRMRLTLSKGKGDLGQPIVTTGFPGGGDFIFLESGPGGMARIVHDHWGAPLVRSEPFRMEQGTQHELVVSFGALFPPQGAPLYQGHPEELGSRGRVVVLWDGERILAAAQACHPTPPSRITVGMNLIGGTSAAPMFSGRIEDVAPAPLESVSP